MLEIVTSKADRAVMTVTIEWGFLPVCFVDYTPNRETTRVRTTSTGRWSMKPWPWFARSPRNVKKSTLSVWIIAKERRKWLLANVACAMT
jgi:hypothetical protein